MNIRDIKEVEIKGDKLDAIFKRQAELEKKYRQIEINKTALTPPTPLDLNTFRGQERVRLLIYRVSEELFEMGNCMRNKAWKETEVPIDIDHFLEELADAFHFFIQLFLELGLSAKQVASLYFRKSLVNKFRIKSKY